MTPNDLRTLAEHHAGTDLAERVARAEGIVRKQADGLRQAADEIERLQAELDRCKSTAHAA